MAKKSEPTIEKMWKKFLKSRSVDMRNQIVVHYSHLVHTHAARLSRKLPAQVSYDEICSAAFDGLIEAVEAYDPQRLAKFETFCQQRISGAVMDWLRSLDPQSRTVRTFEKRRMLAREALGADMDFSPSHEQIAKRMDISIDRFDFLSRLSQLGKEVHFSAMEPSGDRDSGGSSHTWDVRDPQSEDPAVKVSREILTEYLAQGLAREERLVLVLYYFEGMTMAEKKNFVLGIARALINDPVLILADEPTGNLDTDTGQMILSIFERLRSEGKTIIIVTHDQSIANTCDRVITLRDGLIIEDRPGKPNQSEAHQPESISTS